ncbi:hypothetical protein JAAARDRAFT_633082 [Jaapia argillacea MUCL 33604]|uniref:Uncharacterized protein n=1 Tax=Jaapia argillacea MUCL 33604 TaxID=933084 RepID=A0A067Q0Y3_9AGAM|nr:hypothetical protein JAAARDRAFT_633082 [Jaapia argillacea MUCL 33604]
MSTPLQLDFASNTYLAVTLSRSSPYYQSPAGLATHPSVTHIGPVGALPDVQLFSVPNGEWVTDGDAVVRSLDLRREGVVRVDLQSPPRARAKRGDEL